MWQDFFVSKSLQASQFNLSSEILLWGWNVAFMFRQRKNVKVTWEWGTLKWVIVASTMTLEMIHFLPPSLSRIQVRREKAKKIIRKKTENQTNSIKCLTIITDSIFSSYLFFTVLLFFPSKKLKSFPLANTFKQSADVYSKISLQTETSFARLSDHSPFWPLKLITLTTTLGER